VGKFSRLDLAERFSDLKNLPLCKTHDLFVDEKLLWVPQEAYRFAHEFRIKYDGHLTESLIEHLLFELNRVWNQREKKLVSIIKSSYNNDAECKRVLNSPSEEDCQYTRVGTQHFKEGNKEA
jgi:hypothetical protein